MHTSEFWSIFGSLLIQAELQYSFMYTLLHMKFRNHVFEASLLPYSSFLKGIARDREE